jgi:ABC-type sulfate/molybdate transport systems ATPase subunit
MDLLHEIHKTGITMLVVTHDADVAARTQRVIRLRDGKVVDPNDPAAAASHPGMAAAAPIAPQPAGSLTAPAAAVGAIDAIEEP